MPTVKVGKAMLLRRWDEAVALAMTPDDAASDAEKAAKAAFQAAWAEAVALAGKERDARVRAAAAAALQSLPGHCSAEAELLGSLSRGLRPQVRRRREDATVRREVRGRGSEWGRGGGAPGTHMSAWEAGGGDMSGRGSGGAGADAAPEPLRAGLLELDMEPGVDPGNA